MQSETESADNNPDWEYAASDLGISVAEATARYGWQVEFGHAVERLMEFYPDTFSAARINRTGPVGGTVEFVGEVPKDAGAYFRELTVPIEFSGGADYSYQQLGDSINDAHYAVYANSKGLPVATEFSESEQAIIAYVYPRNGAEVGTVDRERLELLMDESVADIARLAGNSTPPTMVIEGPIDGAGDDAVRGGGHLTSCTSGWSVQLSYSALEGIITADHCGNYQEYEGRPILEKRHSMDPARGDIEFQASTENAQPIFRESPTNSLYVTGSVFPLIDGYYCKYGKATGKTCDYVYTHHTCRNDYCNLMAMENRKADGGDSGGPWYSGRVAVGVHSGWYFSQTGLSDQWTPVRGNISDGMGLTLITQ